MHSDPPPKWSDPPRPASKGGGLEHLPALQCLGETMYVKVRGGIFVETDLHQNTWSNPFGADLLFSQPSLEVG